MRGGPKKGAAIKRPINGALTFHGKDQRDVLKNTVDWSPIVIKMDSGELDGQGCIGF